MNDHDQNDQDNNNPEVPAEPTIDAPEAAVASEEANVALSAEGNGELHGETNGEVAPGEETAENVVVEAPRAGGPSPELMAALAQARDAEKPDAQQQAWAAVLALEPRSMEAMEGYTSAIKTQYETLKAQRPKTDAQIVGLLTKAIDAVPFAFELYDILAVQYEAMNRRSEWVSTLQKKAAALRARVFNEQSELLPNADPEEQQQLFQLHLQIAKIFLDKFQNQAEATKAYEAALEVESTNAEAISFLKQMYEKRKDWERLIAVTRREITLETDVYSKTQKTIELAKMAAEKLRKPPVNIELWRAVIDVDPENELALSNLEQLYEREKQWEQLAFVCEKQVEISSDIAKKSAIYKKLGQLWGDKLPNASKAVEAWRGLLVLEPGNKQAQDQLKKKYLELHDWASLEEFYADDGKWDEFIRLLERTVETVEPAAKIDILFTVARLYATKVNQVAKARKAYERIFEFDANNRGAAQALIPIYEDAKDWKSLVGVKEINLSHTAEQPERVELLLEIAALQEERLSDKASAFDTYRRAFEEEWNREDIRQNYERLAQEVDGFAVLVPSYEASFAKYESAADAIPVMLEVGRAYRDNLAQIDGSIGIFNSVLEIDANNPTALDALEGLYEGTERWDSLLAIRLKKAELAEEGLDRCALRYKIAQLLEEKLGRADDAVSTYQDILSVAGEDLAALRALDALYVRQSRHAELAGIIERELEQLPAPEDAALLAAEGEDPLAERVLLMYRLGQLMELHLADLPRAISCYRDILSLQITHDGARVALEGLMQQEEHRLEIANLLEPVYESLEMWDPLIGVKEIQLSASDDLDTRIALLHAIAQLHTERKADHASSFATYARAFLAAPSHEDTRTALETLSEALENWAELVTLYQEKAESAWEPDPELARALYLKIAEIQEARLTANDAAVQSYRRILEAFPTDDATINSLEALYRRTEQWNELFGIFQKKIELAPDLEARKLLHFQVAELLETTLNDSERAIGVYQEVLELDPSNTDSLRSLFRLYGSLERWAEQAASLERQLELVETDEDKIAILLSLAEVRETRMKDVALAVETYKQVTDLDASQADALAALERLIELPEHRLHISRILEPLYEARGDYEKLVWVLEIQLTFAEEKEARVEYLHRIGRLHEEQGSDSRRTFEAYGRALREDPENQSTQENLERLAAQLGDFQALVDLYVQEVVKIQNAQLAVEMHTKIANFQEDQLSNTEGAIEHYRKVLELDGENLNAIRSLKRLYQSSERYRDLVEIMLREADVLTDLDERKELFFTAADALKDTLEDPDGAVLVYNRLLAVDPEEVRGLDALVPLFINGKRWEELASTYERKAELVSDVDQKKPMLYEMGAVYEVELGNLDKSIETYQRVLDLDPIDRTAIEALDRLYQQAQRWNELLAILERERDLADADGAVHEVVGLKYRIGQLLETKLQEESQAVDVYADILMTDPTHQETLAALENVARHGTERLKAALVLQPVYDAQAEYERLVGIYEVELTLNPDAMRKLELLNTIAQIHETSLQDHKSAFVAYARAVRVEGSPLEVLDEHERLAGVVQAWPEVVALYESVLTEMAEQQSTDIDRQRELSRRLARVYREEIQDVAQSISKWQNILSMDPENQEAIDNLDLLYQETRAWPQLAEILAKRAQLAVSDEERVENLYRLAQLREQELKDIEGALAAYREILDMNPDHAQTINALELLFADGTARPEIGQILEPFYERTAEWKKLVELKKELLAFVSEKEERIQAMQVIAELYETRLDDQGSAFEWFGHAFREDPASEFVGQELDRLARITGNFAGLVGLYEERLPNIAEQPELSKDIALRAARCYENDLLDAARAEEAFRRVLGLDPVDSESLQALDRIYLSAGMYAELADVLRRRIGIADNDDDKIQLYFRHGSVLKEELRDLDGAVESFRAILALDSQHKEALESLESIYTQRQQWTELFEVLERQVEITLEAEPQAQYLARMADIAAYRLDQPEKGVELWTRVLDLLNENSQALSALEALHESAQRWEDVVDMLTRQVNATLDEGLKIQLYSKLGKLYDEKLGRENDSIQSWREVLQIDSNSVPSLQALAVLYRRTESWVDLADTLRALIGIGTSVFSEAEVLELYAQLGELYSGTLMQPQDAVDAWYSVLEIDPQSQRALDALETLHRQEAEWEKAVKIVEKKGDLAEDAEAKINHYLQVSDLWNNEIGQPDQSAGVYNKIVELQPGHPIAFKGLEDIYVRNEKWDDLIAMLLDRVDQVSDKEGVPLLRRVAQVLEREQRDPENAFDALLAAAKKDYSDNDTAAELERLTAATNKWSELLQHYTGVLNSVTDDKTTSVALANKIAKWYGEHLQQVDYSIAYYKYVLNLEPANFESLDALEAIYRRQENWPDMVQYLEKRAEATQEPEERKATYHRLAEAYESKLANPVKAIGSLVVVLETLPEDVDTMRSLERLYRDQEYWEQLIDILEKRAKVTVDPDEGIDIRSQIGTVYRDCLQNNQSAIDAFESSLTIDSNHVPTLEELRKLYRVVGDFKNLLRILDMELAVADSDDQRTSLFHEKAQIFEDEFKELRFACECHEQVLVYNQTEDHSFTSLERLYRVMERWEDLIQLYQNHIYAVADQRVRLSHYNDIGKIYREQLKNNASAIESYNAMLDIDRDSIDALDALSRIYEEEQEWDKTMELLQRLVDLLSDQGRRVECYYRMGRIAEGPLSDPDSALERYQFAVDVDPGYLLALASLREIYKARQDWENAISILKQEEAHTSEAETKSALLYHIGYLYHAELSDLGLAQDYYERAMQWNPRNTEAAQPLSDIYFTKEMHAKAEPLLDLLVEAVRSGEVEREKGYLFHYRLAFSSDRLGNTAKADQYYRSAYESNPTYLPTLLGRADLLFRGQDWDQSFRLYQTILANHREEQSEEEIVEVFYRLGTIRREVNDKRKAIMFYEKGLELLPQHRPTLEALINIYTDAGEWENVITYKRCLVDAALDANERFNLLVEIGDLWREKFNPPNIAKSIQAHNDALELQPNNRVVLNKVMMAYNETKQWANAIEVINRIATLEEEAKKRARFNYTIAVILRDEMKQADQALEFFNKTLDDDFEYLKAFEKIDQILTQRKDWKNLERNYRKMIKRIPMEGKTSELQIMLWHGLGEIYRTRQGNLTSAAEAFEAACRLDPDNQIRHEILAELYAADPNQWQKAVEHHNKLLDMKYDRVESFQSLYRIYMQSQQYDKAFCVAAALRFMNRASPEEQGFHEQYRQKGLVVAKRIIDDEVWRTQIADKNENNYISAIFRLISRYVAGIYAQEEKDKNLKRKERVDFAGTKLNFTQRFQQINQIMKVAVPLLYIQPSRPGFDYECLNIDKQFVPAVVAGGDLLSNKGDKEIVFLIAKNLTYLRPEYFLIRALKMNQATIKVILRSAMVMVSPKLAVPPAEQGAVMQFVQKFQTIIPQPIIGQVKTVVERAISEGNDFSTTTWMQNVEIAANRAGLLLCNDLEVAARTVQADPTPLSTLTVKDKLKDLIRYGISEDYFQLRESLGLTIG